MARFTLSIKTISTPAKVFLTLLTIEVLLLLFDYYFNFKDILHNVHIRRIFNVAREESLPTWFSTLQFFFIGALMWVISLLRRKKEQKLFWILSGIFFVFLSADDASKIHERIGHSLKEIVEIGAENGSSLFSLLLDTFPTYGWQIFVAPVYAIIGIYIMLFIISELQSKDLILFFLYGLGAFAIAIGIDYIEGIDGLYDSIAKDLNLTDYTVSHFMKVLEEFLEMLGQTILITTLYKYLIKGIETVTITVD